MKVTVVGGSIPEEEKQAYIDRAKEIYGDRLRGMRIEIDKEDSEFVKLDYDLIPEKPFKRLRRITGYLVGHMERWNNAKSAEEKDRVKHSV